MSQHSNGTPAAEHAGSIAWPNRESEAVFHDVRNEWADPNVMPYYSAEWMDAQAPAVAILEQAEELRCHYAIDFAQEKAGKGFEDLHPAMMESVHFMHAMTRHCLAHVDWLEVSRRLFAMRHLTDGSQPEPVRPKNHPAFEALLCAVYEAVKCCELAFDAAEEAERQDLHPMCLTEEDMAGMLWALKQVFVSLEGSLLQVDALEKMREKWRLRDEEPEPVVVCVEESRS